MFAKSNSLNESILNKGGMRGPSRIKQMATGVSEVCDFVISRPTSSRGAVWTLERGSQNVV